MNVSQKCMDLIIEFEGCRLNAYQDSIGKWTIGYGHTKGVYKGQHISYEEALKFLRQDLEFAKIAVEKYNSKYHWNQNQFDALVSFAFNIGSINQLTKNGTRSIAEISEKIPAYRKAGGKVLTGLVNRRMKEKALFDGEI